MVDLGFVFNLAGVDPDDDASWQSYLDGQSRELRSEVSADVRAANLAAALRLAEAGLFVHPCRHDKTPLTNWRDQSTRDPTIVESMWLRYPDAIPAIDCAKSGLLVVDCDRKPGKPDGVSAFDALLEEHGWTECGPVTMTPTRSVDGRGAHFFFCQPSGEPLGNSTGSLPPGIDVRGAGYVIAPSAVLPDGRKWESAPGFADLPSSYAAGTIDVAPKWLVDMIRAQKQRPEPEPARPRSADTTPGHTADQREQAWAATKLEARAAELAACGEGGRNNALNDAAFSLGRVVARGWISESVVRAALEDACKQNGLMKDDGPSSVRATISSGLRAGLADPHPDLPERADGQDELDRIGDAIAEGIEARFGVNAASSVVEQEDGTIVDEATGQVHFTPEPQTKSETGQGRDELPEHLTRPAGVLGEIVDWITESAQRPNRVLALGAAITVLATIVGRRVAGPTFSGTHQYVIMLAKSAAGKDHPLRRAGSLLSSVNQSLVGPGEFTSQNALVNFLSVQPLSMCALDEFGAFVGRICHARAGNWERGITKSLREFWGASFEVVQGTQWADRKSEPIQWPALSLLGVSTHQEFFDALSSKEATNGFLNRFLMLSTVAKIVDVEEPTANRFEVPDRIKETLRDLYSVCVGDALLDADIPDRTLLNDGRQIPIGWADDETHAEYRSLVRQALAMGESATIGEIYGRTAEIAVRLATIHAVSRAGLTAKVTRQDFEWGRELAMWSADTMAREASMRMSDTETQARANLVLQIIYSAGGRIKHRDLNIKLRHRFKLNDLRDTLSALLESGAISRCESQPPRGGTKTVTYILAGQKG